MAYSETSDEAYRIDFPPLAIRHMFLALSLTQLVDHVDGRGHMVQRSRWQDPMA